jgi:hypothetical protein
MEAKGECKWLAPLRELIQELLDSGVYRDRRVLSGLGELGSFVPEIWGRTIRGC